MLLGVFHPFNASNNTAVLVNDVAATVVLHAIPELHAIFNDSRSERILKTDCFTFDLHLRNPGFGIVDKMSVRAMWVELGFHSIIVKCKGFHDFFCKSSSLMIAVAVSPVRCICSRSAFAASGCRSSRSRHPPAAMTSSARRLAVSCRSLWVCSVVFTPTLYLQYQHRTSRNQSIRPA